MIDVTVLYCRGGYVSTSLMPIEIFHAAGFMWNLYLGLPPSPRFEIVSVSVDGRPVDGAGPTRLVPDKAFQRDQAHRSRLRTDRRLRHRRPRPRECRVPRLAPSAPRRTGPSSPACAPASRSLAEAGLLDGRIGTTHWAIADAFREGYPKVDWRPHLAVTEDRGVFVGGGLYSAIDLALYLVEKLCDRQSAIEVAKALVLQMPRASTRRASPFHRRPPRRRRHPPRRGMAPRSFSVERRSRRAGGQTAMTPRTFLRRFKEATGETPLAYLQRLRIEASKPMLEEDRMTIQEVSLAVGYEDVAFFRDLFKRHTHLFAESVP